MHSHVQCFTASKSSPNGDSNTHYMYLLNSDLQDPYTVMFQQRFGEHFPTTEVCTTADLSSGFNWLC